MLTCRYGVKMQVAKSILDLIGNTPMVKLSNLTKDIEANVLVKLEYLNPSGSLKDRIALKMIEHGLSLVDKQDYDDAIDILQQALGLYDQIGRINEMNLIRKKISEIYIRWKSQNSLGFNYETLKILKS